MSTIITVASDRFLLEKEDFPEALAALTKLAAKSPRDLELLDEVVAATELPEALRAAGLYVRQNDEGDIVMLGADDQAPADASSRWPHSIVHAIAKFVRHAEI